MTLKRPVMIVDDDAHVRITVKTILSSEGFDVIMADSGNQCLNLLQEGFEGVILLDIMMPEMDGWDTIQSILDKDLYKKIVIAMLTAKSVPDQKMIGLQEYVMDYIVKPFESDDLVEKTTYLLKFVTA